jgi:lysophospholipase L1-like esterase
LNGPVEFRDATWQLIREPVDGSAWVFTPLRAADAAGTELLLAEAPRVVTPDRRCTLYLTAFATATSDDRRVMIIGDSIAHALAPDASARASLEATFNIRHMRVAVDGQSGLPWFFQSDGTDMRDEFRGVEELDPDVIAVSLGTNDALLAALYPDDAERRVTRDLTATAIATILAELATTRACVVLITPPDAPTTQFNAGTGYASESRRLGAVLRSFAAVYPRVRIADFAASSRAHHDGGDGWFTADELHPNATGVQALASVLLDAIATCP